MPLSVTLVVAQYQSQLVLTTGSTEGSNPTRSPSSTVTTSRNPSLSRPGPFCKSGALDVAAVLVVFVITYSEHGLLQEADLTLPPRGWP